MPIWLSPRKFALAGCPDISAAMTRWRRLSVQIVEGERDQLVLPVAADYIAAKVKHAKKSYYPHVGHAPTIEDTERFNRERP